MLFKVKKSYLQDYSPPISIADDFTREFCRYRYINVNQIKNKPILYLNIRKDFARNKKFNEIRRKVLFNGEVCWIHEDCLEKY